MVSPKSIDLLQPEEENSEGENDENEEDDSLCVDESEADVTDTSDDESEED